VELTSGNTGPGGSFAGCAAALKEYNPLVVILSEKRRFDSAKRPQEKCGSRRRHLSQQGFHLSQLSIHLFLPENNLLNAV
jgi:hypothetical protein